MKTIKCNPHNYGAKRKHDDVEYIVIHYTAVKGDTAVSEGKNFSRAHDPKTSAHFFIDRAGDVVKSVPLNYIAYSVGGNRYSDYKKTGGAAYYGKCKNLNSVSIELCDITDINPYPSTKQVKACKRVIKYIRKYCKNADIIIRHFDVTGKYCPRTMCEPYGTEARWLQLRAELNR